MKAPIKLIICIAIVCSLCRNDSLGCSLGVAPISQFDKDQYVFIGSVTDVVGPFKSEAKKADGEAWGLQIKVDHQVYLPQSPTDYFEVFPYHLTSMCGLAGWSREQLLDYYPIGTQVRVIAKESTLLESKLTGGNVRLETSIYNRGSVARNVDPDLTASVDSVYDYRKYADRQSASADEYPIVSSNYSLPDFELRKDLLRLREATSEEEKIPILERLAYFPHVYYLDYPKIAQSHIRNEVTLKRLTATWEAWKRKKNEGHEK